MGDDENPRTIQFTTKDRSIMYRVIPNIKGPAKFFDNILLYSNLMPSHTCEEYYDHKKNDLSITVSAKIITKRVAMREMRRPPDFILEIPIKDFFARQMKLSYARKILSFRTSKTISYDSEWKISFMSDNDIETGFLVHLQTLDILDTKKVLPFIMTDEIYQVCLPLARILDISDHLLEENRNDVNKSVNL
ncbi:unnamed protein product [Rhizophagus irregularis]|nr:unnamed protein product [Rhizophagus irregularis]